MDETVTPEATTRTRRTDTSPRPGVDIGLDAASFAQLTGDIVASVSRVIDGKPDANVVRRPRYPHQRYPHHKRKRKPRV